MSEAMISARVLIRNQRGLHARAAAKVVRLVSVFGADIAIIKEEMKANAKSIMGLMMLGAAPGTELEVQAQGADAMAAMTALVDLIERGFDED